MAELKLYNSLSKGVETFAPREPGKVRIYNCGPTVYKRQHIGNMRRFLFADFLRRALEFLGYEVREITNITDVGHLTQDDIDAGEDKLEKEARAQKLAPQDIAKKQTDLFLQDLQALNIQPAHAYPKASDHVTDMVELIEKLIANGHAYQTKTGVYFDVQSFPEYGALSGNTLDKLAAGARVEVREEKKHPADFALWKTNDPEHLQQWASPWGRGYPGWHIECSAMSLKYLGPEIDIHTGGEDNRFPHHENEIAQSEGAFRQAQGPKPHFVRFWMHNAFLKLQGEKLAKREGEQITLDTLRERSFSPLAFRLLIFGSHYRSPLEFSWENLTAASKQLETMRQLVRRTSSPIKPDTSPYEGEVDRRSGEVLSRFAAALADDLNTPAALAAVMDYIREVNTQLESGVARTNETWATLLAMDKVLGIIEPLQREIELETVPDEIKELAEQREEARRQRQFEKADQLRREIETKGWRLEDTESGARILPRSATP